MTYIQIHKGRGLILLAVIVIVLSALVLMHSANRITYINQATPVFLSCAQAKAAGRSSIPSTDPAYQLSLDRDKDGRACE